MKTKRFLRLHLGWQALSLFSLVLAVSSMYFAIEAIVAKQYLGLLMLIPLICFSYLFITCEHNRIVLKNDSIYAPDDWLSKRQKIQYKTTIRYDEIVEISLVKTIKNSLGKNIKILSPMTSLTFMEFKCKDGTNKYLFVFYHTNKQRIKIIEQIKQRMKVVGNDAIIPDAKDIIENFNTLY